VPAQGLIAQQLDARIGYVGRRHRRKRATTRRAVGHEGRHGGPLGGDHGYSDGRCAERAGLVQGNAAADHGNARPGHLTAQAARRPNPADLVAGLLRGADEPAGHTYPGTGLGIDDRLGDVDRQLGARAAAERDQDRVGVAELNLVENRRVEHGEVGTGQCLPMTGARVASHTTVDHQVRVGAAESKVVHADDQAASAAAGENPASGIHGDRIVDDEHVGRERSQQARRSPAHDIAPKREGNGFDGRAPAQRDQRTYAQRPGQRTAPHEVTEPAARTGRRAEHHTQISARRHGRLR